jgi:hypothetical protein
MFIRRVCTCACMCLRCFRFEILTHTTFVAASKKKSVIPRKIPKKDVGAGEAPYDPLLDAPFSAAPRSVFVSLIDCSSALMMCVLFCLLQGNNCTFINYRYLPLSLPRRAPMISASDKPLARPRGPPMLKREPGGNPNGSSSCATSLDFPIVSMILLHLLVLTYAAPRTVDRRGASRSR